MHSNSGLDLFSIPVVVEASEDIISIIEDFERS